MGVQRLNRLVDHLFSLPLNHLQFQRHSPALFPPSSLHLSPVQTPRLSPHLSRHEFHQTSRRHNHRAYPQRNLLCPPLLNQVSILLSSPHHSLPCCLPLNLVLCLRVNPLGNPPLSPLDCHRVNPVHFLRDSLAVNHLLNLPLNRQVCPLCNPLCNRPALPPTSLLGFLLSSLLLYQRHCLLCNPQFNLQVCHQNNLLHIRRHNPRAYHPASPHPNPVDCHPRNLRASHHQNHPINQLVDQVFNLLPNQAEDLVFSPLFNRLDSHRVNQLVDRQPNLLCNPRRNRRFSPLVSRQVIRLLSLAVALRNSPSQDPQVSQRFNPVVDQVVNQVCTL